MARYGMVIDTTKCIGCGACRLACQNQNDVPASMPFVKFSEAESGTYPTASLQVIPSQCMHCEDAPCQTVCPTGATYTNEDGIVCIDHGRCIGCKYCMAACPYRARVVDERTGSVDKCRFCTVSALHGTEMSTCVTACPAGVRTFGDLDDPDSDVSRVLAATHATPLLGDATKSKIFYVR
ncbi:4Fe-4S dicluster domain-containing protein [Slackia exigua]|uniref:4Fe-4S dicluster domain-containing protein n=1 Tax=Slackia exigua TaxID=84109 RepID=UPI0028DC3AF7|nr:4Fe-4S dicluster domain-containing protein [Slackia exigua]